MRLMPLIRLLMSAGWPAHIGHPEQDCLSALAADWLASRALTEDAIANGIGAAGIGLAAVTVSAQGRRANSVGLVRGWCRHNKADDDDVRGLARPICVRFNVPTRDANKSVIKGIANQAGSWPRYIPLWSCFVHLVLEIGASIIY